MFVMVEDKQLLENFKKIWKKIKRLMGVDFESKATYDDKYINTKVKTYKDSITANIYDETGFKEVPEEKVPHKCLSIIILDSVLYAQEKYYPQTFLEECRYVKKLRIILIWNWNQNLIAIVIVIMVFILILMMKNKSDSNNNKQNFLIL